MNYKWNYEAPTPTEAAAQAALAREVGIHPALGKLLFDRGITTAQQARHFFRPQLTELHDPFTMNDMQVAVDRLNLAMGRKERIMVYGDYDVDGCTLTSTFTFPTVTKRATASQRRASTSLHKRA